MSTKLTKWGMVLFIIAVLVIITNFVILRPICEGDMICVGVGHIWTGIIAGSLIVIMIILLVINKFKK